MDIRIRNMLAALSSCRRQTGRLAAMTFASEAGEIVDIDDAPAGFVANKTIDDTCHPTIDG